MYSTVLYQKAQVVTTISYNLLTGSISQVLWNAGDNNSRTEEQSSF
jgi:hypothetical protein